MAKITIDDLKKIKEKVHKEMSLRDGDRRVKVTVHMGTCGIASGAAHISFAAQKAGTFGSFHFFDATLIIKNFFFTLCVDS
mgnify:CR=1 FL=1